MKKLFETSMLQTYCAEMVRKFFFGGGALGGKAYFVENVSSVRLLVHTADTPHGSADVCKTLYFQIYFEYFYILADIFQIHVKYFTV